MKYRFATVIVLLVYLSVAVVFGTVHHHHTQDCGRGQKDCAACDWQLNAVTDVPTTVPLIFGCLQETPLQIFDFVSYSAPLFSYSLSRAPPATSA
jgi:hypothetical protein